MAKTYGEELRCRVIAAVAGGMSRRAAAARFQVGVTTAITWVQAWFEEGRSTAKPKAAIPIRTGSRRIGTLSSTRSRHSRTSAWRRLQPF